MDYGSLGTGDILAFGDLELVVHSATASARGSYTVHDRKIHVHDRAMRQLFALVRDHLAPAEMPVVIEGETGTGKDLVASALHALSPRRECPFIAVNCAALPETLVESELFGHERGAFSGAGDTKAGLIEAAHRGVLFLDEIGELPLAIQAKLLRVLDSKKLRRVGDVAERPVDVRIIAATNRTLEDEVEAGRFRRDLYFRLQGASLWIPPLRMRTRELPVLAELLLAEACDHAAVPRIGLDAAAIERIVQHDWPGNVRELKNFARYAVAVIHGETVGASLVDEWIAKATRKTAQAKAPLPSTQFRPIGEEIAELEKMRMREALSAAGGNRKRAAELISMPLRTFATRLKTYDLD